MGNAAAVLPGTWGAVSRRARQSGSSRPILYHHAQRVVQAVFHAQAGGSSYETLEEDNERLRGAHAALGQAWAEAAELCEAKPREFAAASCAMGWSLRQIVTWLAIVLPSGAVPRWAPVGRVGCSKPVSKQAGSWRCSSGPGRRGASSGVWMQSSSIVSRA